MRSGNSLIVTYTSYLILKQAAPEVKPHTVCALALGRGCRSATEGVEGIDYGPVGRIFEQYANLLAIYDNSDERFENPIQFWRWLLTQEGRTDEDILHDAWRGPGNMWVFVRPDRCVDWHSLFQRRCLIKMKVSRRGDACRKADSQLSGYLRHRTNPPKCKLHSWINRPRHCPRHMRISAHSINICPHHDLQAVSLYHFTTRKPDLPASTYRRRTMVPSSGPLRIEFNDDQLQGHARTRGSRMVGGAMVCWWHFSGGIG